MNMNGLFPIEYEALVWNCIDSTEETVYGITIAESFTDGMEKIEGYYGEELIQVTLYMCEESSVYELDNLKEGLFKRKIYFN